MEVLVAGANVENHSDLDIAVGRRLREIRGGAGLSRETLALRARHWGFPWTANTLALIEAGRRRLALGEFLLLPTVLNELIPGTHLSGTLDQTRHPFSYADVLPEPSTTCLAVTPKLFTWPDGLRQLVQSHGVMLPNNANLFDRPRERELQYYDDPTDRAAKSLGAPIQAVAKAAEVTWGRPFSHERDARLGTAPHTDRAQVLGHITRVLVEELRPVLAEMGVKPKSSKKKGGRSKRKKQ